MTNQPPHEWGRPRPGAPTTAAVRRQAKPPPQAVRQPVPTRTPPRRQRRRVWPWILGLMTGFLLLIAGCVVAVVALTQAPLGAANEFMALVADDKLEAAYNALCTETRNDLSYDAFVEDLTLDEEITSYTLTPSVVAAGGSARISGTVKIGDEPRNVAFRMTKENRDWRVCGYDPLNPEPGSSG